MCCCTRVLCLAALALDAVRRQPAELAIAQTIERRTGQRRLLTVATASLASHAGLSLTTFLSLL